MHKPEVFFQRSYLREIREVKLVPSHDWHREPSLQRSAQPHLFCGDCYWRLLPELPPYSINTLGVQSRRPMYYQATMFAIITCGGYGYQSLDTNSIIALTSSIQGTHSDLHNSASLPQDCSCLASGSSLCEHYHRYIVCTVDAIWSSLGRFGLWFSDRSPSNNAILRPTE